MAEKQAAKKQTFISGTDRPETTIDPDRPITELRVRDLAAIVGSGMLRKIKEQAEHKKAEKFEKVEQAEYKKPEKLEKLEKFEVDGVKRVGDQFDVPDPRVIEQIAFMLTDLTANVGRLADQVAELERRV